MSDATDFRVPRSIMRRIDTLHDYEAMHQFILDWTNMLKPIVKQQFLSIPIDLATAQSHLPGITDIEEIARIYAAAIAIENLVLALESNVGFVPPWRQVLQNEFDLRQLQSLWNSQLIAIAMEPPPNRI